MGVEEHIEEISEISPNNALIRSKIPVEANTLDILTTSIGALGRKKCVAMTNPEVVTITAAESRKFTKDHKIERSRQLLELITRQRRYSVGDKWVLAFRAPNMHRSVRIVPFRHIVEPRGLVLHHLILRGFSKIVMIVGKLAYREQKGLALCRGMIRYVLQRNPGLQPGPFNYADRPRYSGRPQAFILPADQDVLMR
jgi:hypothetical protein